MSQMAVVAQTLAFLAVAAGLVVALAATMVCLLIGRLHSARRAAQSGVSLAAGYLALLLVASATSRTTVLPFSASKVFCEFDCHVVFDLPDGAWRADDTVTITVRESFDAASISRERGDAPLTPGSRHIVLVDDAGQRYGATTVRTLSASPLFATLRPGESHRAQLRFLVPRAVPLRGLLIESDDAIARLLIGHERSPFHGVALLDISPPGRAPTPVSSRR